ncbi:DUF2059 domain-containing protein [Pseudoduganella sp. FT55W]|uniref:DUF2059 domain-containing protein n=1 Tax=Duganella rivi TaxID=2666083 RepID=A0A7X4GTV3_9BURK|nr:DUF2059 domain-containing protein [Duganella rivi]MYM69020.1 DUF2059 domain-containing protein [Duganella rivi]
MLDATGIQAQVTASNEQGQASLKKYARRETGIVAPAPAPLQAAQQELASAYIAEIDAMAPQISWEAVKPSLIRFCADNYTDAQLDAITSFFNSPAGRVLRDKQNTLNQAAGASMHELEQQIFPRTLEATAKFQAQVKALHEHGAQTASP